MFAYIISMLDPDRDKALTEQGMNEFLLLGLCGV